MLAVSTVVGITLWQWINGLGLNDPVQNAKATAQLDAVKIAASIAVGGGGLFALYLAARRQRTQELELEVRHAELAQRDHAQDDTRVDAAARRVTELYAKAAEQLGSDKAPVRLAGLYALERLAQTNPAQQQTVVNVMCAYLRMPYRPPGDLPDDHPNQEQFRVEQHELLQEREVRLAAQRILSLHLNPGYDPQRPAPIFWPDMNVDFSGATLIEFDLSGCHLNNARFQKARFIGGTLFRRTTFKQATWFTNSNFTHDADFGDTQFIDFSVFIGVRFEREANFRKVHFRRDAVFGGIAFEGRAVFSESVFGNDAQFIASTFSEDADFSKASFQADADFAAASCKTRQPDFSGAKFAGKIKGITSVDDPSNQP